MEYLFLQWLIVLILPSLCICLDQASFYGNSFISLPLKEAKGHTDIHFKFRSQLSNALIFLVAGSIDYCILRLDDSRLKVNINLGSGEFEIASPPGVKLNDLEWHEVTVIRREASLSLVIDNRQPIKKQLPGKFFELNIHYGLFVGGYGNFTDVFFGHQENFRGCLSDLIYNGIPVLERVRFRQTQATVQGITWNCGAEIDADSNQPISFVDDGAYFTVTTSSKLDMMSWQFELKTVSEKNAIILYNTGLPSKLDTVSLELWKGKLKLLLKIGNNKVIDGTSDIFVADGQWHKVTIRILSPYIELNVDSRTKSLKFFKAVGSSWETSDLLYIGGVDDYKRTKLSAKGLKIPDSSFKGCIRYIKVGTRQIGLRDARATEGLLNGCMWKFPCLGNNPCTNQGTCVQQGLDSYQCLCKSGSCSNSTNQKSKVISRGSLATDLELLILEPLQVMEGQSVLITTTNLHVVLDYPKYGIGESGVIFHILEMPEHGNVVIDVWPHEKNSFTLADISKDKVYYVHDGSEYTEDIINMEVEFSATDVFILPVYLQGRFKLTINVNITPINDPPVLNIPPTAVLRLARGTKGLINRELVNVIDPDSSTDQLVFSVVDPGSGHLEHLRNSGKPINSFTQQEMDDDQVVFVHHATAPDDSYLSLRVSDGMETSKIAKLRISAFQQVWRIQNNTGLIVMHEGVGVITSYNISFTSNVQQSLEEAQYYIVQEPQLGVVEIETSLDVWKKATTFTSDDLRRRRIRYRHLRSKPNHDEFQFRTTLNSSLIYTFRITFKNCELISSASNRLQMNDVGQSPITQAHLNFRTEPIASSTAAILFVITDTPKYGSLFLSDSKYQMGVGDTFSQEDILANNINYHFFRKPYSFINDSFDYAVMIRGCKNKTGNISIEYRPSEDTLLKANVILQTLKVEEGGSAVIDSLHLNIVSKLVSELQYNVTEPPRHGYLKVNYGDLIRNKTSYFTTTELLAKAVVYVHDDSETKNDTFRFFAYSTSDMEDFQFSEEFIIEVALKNDNSPYRIVDKVFEVVVNGQKLLTASDLKYADPDSDTPPSTLVYTYRDLPNGKLYNLRNLSAEITEFSQKDLDDGILLFKHNGPKYGKGKLWITDGQFYVDGILQIQASAPFIRIGNGKKLLTQHGHWAIISSQHLFVETNLYTTDDEVNYEIITKPLYGKIITAPDLLEVSHFTQTMINIGHVFYAHENGSNAVSVDQVSLRVRCKDAVNVTQLNVWMLPASYWDPLILKNSRLLTVEESTSAVIDSTILEVSQSSDVPAGAIMYTITEYPHNGYLSIVPVADSESNEPLIVTVFTQALINENRLVYVQSRSNQTTDTIGFNVTNSMVWLSGVNLDIQIIPEHLYLGSNVVNVNEGGKVVLTGNHIYVQTEYFKSKVTDYVVVKPPLHGVLENRDRNHNLGNFSHEELIIGTVQYVHDNSENLHDQFTVLGITDNKKSMPLVVDINVTSVNDQIPMIVNNTGLTMWEGGLSVITNEMLSAVDLDTPADSIVFQILGCWWGNVSIVSEPDSSLRFFTQELINQEVIVFRHQNGSDAKFTFNISDGLHIEGSYTFVIRTKPVQLKLVEKSVLHVFPLQKKLITSKNLLATVSDRDRSIYFRIIQFPRLGRLIARSSKKDNVFQLTNGFTQSDINDGKIFYEHTHPFEDLYADDSFTFDIESHLAAPLTNQKFKIDISVSSGGLDAYINIPKVRVDEGGITNIKLNLSGVVSFLENHSGLKSPIIHASTVTNSIHGQVFLQPESNLTTFTQNQLENGQVYYQHDHSDTLEDNVFLSLYLLPGYITLCNITIPIQIDPINDQPFKLVTPAPHFVVVQGENHTITNMELCTEDPDTAPVDILYDIITAPSEGRLILLPEGIPISHFSQDDIDMGRLVYIHDGVLLADVFHLRVWDGKFRHDYTVFNIQVTPILFNVSVGVPLYIQQGSNVVLLSRKQFAIETNADVLKIQYVIQDGPRHGVVYVKDAPATSFKQAHLDNGEVMYMQTDMTTANDSIRIYVTINVVNTTIGDLVDVTLKVQPLMQIRNVTIIAGTSNRIGVNVLDATPLAKLTNSNPSYSIVEFPKYGQVRKIIRSSGQTRNVLDSLISSFTHEEVQSGLIYLITRDLDVVWDGLSDELHFILAATIFQPAMGKLKITIKANSQLDVYTTLSSPSDPAGRDGATHVASPNMTRDYFLIVSMVVGVIVLGVTVIVIIKCRALEPDITKDTQSLQPIPLPRPPDTLMTSPSPIKQHLHDEFNSSLPSTLPQCKVTPLSDTHTRYPYGIEEHLDDWSSCDASDPSCQLRNNIMLRRNQYWV
uniref:Chondroitin sulfate proteoglycan 4 n=2 Tax=Photinus pyralis TaxID=7054 RepID=A0A1Y1JQR6_PHOPY